MIDILVLGGIFREVMQGASNPKLQYGGSGLVSAMSAARLGLQVALASYVGEEDESAVRDELRLVGVDEHSVLSVAGASGTFVFPEMSSDQPWPLYRPAEATPFHPPPNLPRAPIVLIFGIPDFDPISEGWLNSVGPVDTIIWDQQGWLSRSRNSRAAASLSSRRKIYLANKSEAKQESETNDIDWTFGLQPPAGFDVAVIKKGIEGVTVVENSGGETTIIPIPSYPVETPSSIGSGDVFAGVFAARLAYKDSPIEAARWGCAGAAVALQSGTNRLGDGAIEAIKHLLSNQ